MIWKNISNGMDLFDSRLHFSFVKAGYQLVSRLQAGSTLHRLPVFQSDAIPSFQQFLRRSVRNAVHCKGSSQVAAGGPNKVSGKHARDCFRICNLSAIPTVYASLVTVCVPVAKQASCVLAPGGRKHGYAVLRPTPRAGRRLFHPVDQQFGRCCRSFHAGMGSESSTVSSRSCPMPVMTGNGNCAQAAASR